MPSDADRAAVLLAVALLGNPLLGGGTTAHRPPGSDHNQRGNVRAPSAGPIATPALQLVAVTRVGRRHVPTSRYRAEQLRSVVASTPWRSMSFTIRTLSPEARFELRDGKVTTDWPPTKIHDRYGIPMRLIDGSRRYHPLALTRLGLKYLSRYRGTNDPLFLDRAKRIAAGLERIGVRARNAIWFPYRFMYPAGPSPRPVNRPPWYSGYAQGFALSFFVRLWEQTREDEHRVLADLSYNSLRNLGRGPKPWVSWIDRRGYLWVDEYPEQLDQTFNGHVFALFGLHDYLEMTKDRDLYPAARHASVLALLRGGITTIRAYASTFRNPGTVSDYCLAHHARNRHYHPIHVRQLRHLAAMTGDRWFTRMANRFAADAR